MSLFSFVLLLQFISRRNEDFQASSCVLCSRQKHFPHYSSFLKTKTFYSPTFYCFYITSASTQCSMCVWHMSLKDLLTYLLTWTESWLVFGLLYWRRQKFANFKLLRISYGWPGSDKSMRCCKFTSYGWWVHWWKFSKIDQVLSKCWTKIEWYCVFTRATLC